MTTLIRSFDARLANRPFLVLTFGNSGAQPWAPECPKVKTKNGRLASLASNFLSRRHHFGGHIMILSCHLRCHVSPSRVCPSLPVRSIYNISLVHYIAGGLGCTVPVTMSRQMVPHKYSKVAPSKTSGCREKHSLLLQSRCQWRKWCFIIIIIIIIK